jgi:hypothetical protein
MAASQDYDAFAREELLVSGRIYIYLAFLPAS